MIKGIYAIHRADARGRFYIGSAIDIFGRWRLHRHQLRSGEHHSKILQRAWDKHGEASFEFVILEQVLDKAHLISREQAWMDRFSPRYNVCKVAGSPLGFRHSPETIAKLSVISSARTASQETRERMSIAQKAREGNNYWGGKSHTQETRAKMAASARARWARPGAKEARKISAEHRAKMLEGHRRHYDKLQAGGQ